MVRVGSSVLAPGPHHTIFQDTHFDLDVASSDFRNRHTCLFNRSFDLVVIRTELDSRYFPGTELQRAARSALRNASLAPAALRVW